MGREAGGVTDRRRERADAAFEAHDLGDVCVVDASGWEWVEPGRTWERTFFYAVEPRDVEPRDDEGGTDEPTATGRFVVTFADAGSAVIAEVVASAADGSDLGRPVAH